MSACSSGSGSTPASTRPAGGSTSSPQPSAVVATQVDPATVPLQPDSAAQQGYTISVPADWQAENIPMPGGFGRRYTMFNGGARQVQITVSCNANTTVSTMQTQDNSIVQSLKGTYAVNGMTDVTLAGLQGKSTDYSLIVGGLKQESHVIYLQGKTCGWRLLMQGFGAGVLERYTTLLERISATFKPADAAG